MNYKINYIDEKEKYIALYKDDYKAICDYVDNLPKNSKEEWDLFNKMNEFYQLYPENPPEWIGDEDRIWMSEYLFYSTANVGALVGFWLFFHEETAYNDYIEIINKTKPYIPETNIKYTSEFDTYIIKPEIEKKVKEILRAICYEWECEKVRERYMESTELNI